MDETEEYMAMNDAYKKRIIQTLRNTPVGTPKDAPAYVETKKVEPKKEKDPYDSTLRGRISGAMDKYLGPKDMM